jgi:hypothetical protein
LDLHAWIEPVGRGGALGLAERIVAPLDIDRPAC